MSEKFLKVLKSTYEYLMYFSVGSVIVWGLHKHLLITLLLVCGIIYVVLCYAWNLMCRRYTASKYLDTLRLSDTDDADTHNISPYAFYTQEMNRTYKENRGRYLFNTAEEIFEHTYSVYEYGVIKYDFDIERAIDRAQEYHKGLYYCFRKRFFTGYFTMKAVFAGKLDFKIGG